ncbi:MAG: SRPBCC family protein [Mycobacterium sp.]|uniref:SRPBCC family protein n=1 Tax=Mycobacterium sp. TaxID=1785 RepID=UPI003F9ADB5D
MKLEHSFAINEGIDAAWDVLNDVRRIAQCMPGASVDTVDGNDVTGRCKVKLGPIGLTYKGRATFVERDVETHRIVLEGLGQDGANGRASVTVVANLTAEGAGTRVDLETDLKLTGKPAQFGRGVMADVGDRMIGQFADALAEQLAAEKQTPGGDGPGIGADAADLPTNEPLDLLSAARPIVVRRAATVVGPLLVVVALLAACVRQASRWRNSRRR